MSNLFVRSHERRLIRAIACHRRGRAHIIWFRGVLYFGVPLFILLNVADYYFDRGAPYHPADLLRILGYLLLSLAAGYLYGRLIWRNLNRAFGPQSPSSGSSSSQPIQ
jgi:hypothetical protein